MQVIKRGRIYKARKTAEDDQEVEEDDFEENEIVEDNDEQEF